MPIVGCPTMTPYTRVYDLALAYRFSRALYVAVQLRIPDLLKDGPSSVQTLASATRTEPTVLFQLLSALTTVGVFAQITPGEFSLTPLSETLRSDIPNSLRANVLLLIDDTHWDVYKELGYSIRTGQPAFDRIFGETYWEYLTERPQAALLVDQAMAARSRSVGPAIAEAYDFSQFQTIIDVGGGTGALLAAILKRNPESCGILFDLEHVIQHALATRTVPENRTKLITGNFFDAIPSGADVYVLKNIIHDWPDRKARHILANCRTAISGTGKLLLIETLLAPQMRPDYLATASDLEMLVMQSGRERTAEDFSGLLMDAHFRLNRVIPTTTPLSIIEASPA
ncbi:MAG TPA: methyltransferase [Bryobacteraceae bacterium]|nr:methyltransferase [Bryobacteraceae bacterium]